MQIHSVGANCVRPPEIMVNPTGEHSSPLQKQSIEFALTNDFLYRKQIWS